MYKITLETAEARLNEARKNLAEVNDYLERGYIRSNGIYGFNTNDPYVALMHAKEARLHRRVYVYKKIVGRLKGA